MIEPKSESIAVRNADSEIAVTANFGPALVKTQKSLGELETAVNHYPDAIRVQTHWLQGFFLEHCDGNVLTLRAICAKLSADWDKSEEFFYNILRGYYFRQESTKWKPQGAAWMGFLDMIEALRRYAQNAARTGKMPFVQTPTYRCISDFITARRALEAVCKFGAICGPTGAQKSESFKFYAALNNHSAVKHLEAPSNGKLGTLQRKIASAYNVSNRKAGASATRETEIRDNVNETRTLIIDNVQRLYVSGAGSNQPAFNWLLELQDDTDCTLILSFTEDFVDTLNSGRARGYFEQFVGRFGGLDAMLKLPKFAPSSDLRVIARAFKLNTSDSAMKYLHEWSRMDGKIRIVFHKLQLAQTFARADKRDRITLADLEEAHSYMPPATGIDEEGGAS